MEIVEIKENKEMSEWMEIKLKDIQEKIFIVNIKKINTIEEFKDRLSEKLRRYYKRIELKELAKTYPTREELKNQIKELVGEDIQPKEVDLSNEK